MKKSIALLLGLSFAQNSLAMDIKEALSIAYDKSPQIKSYQEEYISAMQEYPEVLSSGFLPDISISTSTSSQKGRDTEVGQNLPRKMTGYSRQLNISQNLFAGGSSVSNLAAVKHKIDASKIRYILQEQEFLLKATIAYIEAIVSKEKLEATNALVASLEKEYESAEEKMNVGEATKTDVAAAKAEKSNALAQKAKANSEYLANVSRFSSLFGVEPKDLVMPEIPKDLPDNFETFNNKATLLNLNVRYSRSQMLSSKNFANAAKGALLPRVELQASKSQNSTRGDTNSSLVSKRDTLSTSLVLNIPILSHGGAEHSKVRKAKAQHRRAAYEQDQALKNNTTQLIQDWENFIAAKQTVQFGAEALEAKTLELEGRRSMYEVGISTMLDVLKTEKEHYEAVVRNIMYKEELIKAAFTVKSDLAQLTAKDMGLNAKIFDPEREFRKTKFKVVGF